jgi:hypothetical protein
MICVLEKILFKTPAAAAVTTAALFFAVKLGGTHGTLVAAMVFVFYWSSVMCGLSGNPQHKITTK